jgi:hypothetical protein
MIFSLFFFCFLLPGSSTSPNSMAYEQAPACSTYWMYRDCDSRLRPPAQPKPFFLLRFCKRIFSGQGSTASEFTATVHHTVRETF